MAHVKRRTVPVLLLEDDEKLGHVGDVIEVKPGYARNFLIPTGIACPVTRDALQRVERAKQQAAHHRAERAARVAAVAEALDGLSLMFEERASEEGHLFGSVSAARIVEELAARDVAVEEKQVELDAPLRELGIFNVPIRLDADTTRELRVWIVEA